MGSRIRQLWYRRYGLCSTFTSCQSIRLANARRAHRQWKAGYRVHGFQQVWLYKPFNDLAQLMGVYPFMSNTTQVPYILPEFDMVCPHSAFPTPRC